MANYYSDYAAKMKCPKEAADDFCQLVRFANDCGEKCIPDWFVNEYGARTPDDVFKEFSENGAMFSGITETEYAADKGIFSFSARKYANPQFLINVLPKIMGHYSLKKPVAVEIAQTADKSCEDGFGGCVFVFGPNIWKAVDTRDMAAILKKEVSDIAKINTPAVSPEVLCWSGLTVANVKTEFPDLEEKWIHAFIVEHEDGICEAMSNAAMSYVINNIQERQNG